MQKARVLVFTTAYKPLIGGSEIALEETVRHLPDIFFDIVTPKHKKSFLKKECGSNFCIHRVGFGISELSDKLAFICLGFFKASQLLLKNKYLAIHAYQASYGGGTAWIVKTFFPKTKFILTLQEGKNLGKQNFLIRTARSMILKKADTITVISSYLKNYAQAINKKAKIVIIPNGVDLNKFLVASNFNKDTIITVSRLVEKNGVHDLIKAMGKVLERFPEAKLLLIGSGPEEKKLKEEVKSMAIGESVEFLGEISYDKIPNYLSSASVFVRPSLSEGLGSAFLEAMASGLAIIGTPVGGIPDFLQDGVAGLFCKPEDPSDIADKVIQILGNDELRKKLAENGRRLVEEKYSWEKISKQLQDLYESTNT